MVPLFRSCSGRAWRDVNCRGAGASTDHRAEILAALVLRAVRVVDEVVHWPIDRLEGDFLCLAGGSDAPRLLPHSGLIPTGVLPVVGTYIKTVVDCYGPDPRRGAVGFAILTERCRLIDLLDTPQDIPFLSGLIQREIIYRILRGPELARLRAIATLGDQSHRTSKAIAWISTNYAKPLRVEDLAQITNMGVSTLHHHFRALTAMSPLQYQKQLRLQAARGLMLVNGLDATSAAFEVGYESASQFNREYGRFFGQPPVRDIQSLRSPGAAPMEAVG
jgi:AraC-like DNA-binding protein